MVNAEQLCACLQRVTTWQHTLSDRELLVSIAEEGRLIHIGLPIEGAATF